MIFTELFLASLALAPALALPAAPTEGDSEVFSFGKWIDGIIANPDGNNLTPDEAVAAWSASSNGTRAGALEKRAPLVCTGYSFCKVADAVWCINYLATIGGQGQRCEVTTAANWCGHGSARLNGLTAVGASTSSNCNDVARAGGYIMDACTRSDGLVSGTAPAYGNGNLIVEIRN
ncbi:hypothetical protein C8A00DRAFT_19799 [Chaetomidium leptoderma]|uniref:Uncharacterized protein n=1 Tax=Chaetomidium leptoderma TaxID=669021 RepID=A0AAN6ZSF2_9PEZI|nr:hypothetical protein C8A00DRAFT_19799 [Chaetomidium leptoderma]